jgi:hypothetical protein
MTTKLQELEVMAAKLQATARKLPHRPDRRDLLQEIGRFRVQIIALQSAGLRSAGPCLVVGVGVVGQSYLPHDTQLM